MRYVFVMTGSVVESATPLSEPLYKPLDAAERPAEVTEAPKARKAPAKRTATKRAAEKEA